MKAKPKVKRKTKTNNKNFNFGNVFLVALAGVLFIFALGLYFQKGSTIDNVKSTAVSINNKKVSNFSLSWLIEKIKSFFARNTPPKKSPPNYANLSFLKVKGDKIVNSKGEAVYLHGFQGVGSYYSVDKELYLKAVWDRGVDPYSFDPIAEDLSRYTFTDFDVQEIKSTGANVGRMWFDLHEIQKKPYEYSETTLKLLEDRVNLLGRGGIYVILLLGGTGQNDYEDSKIFRDRGLNFWDKSSGLWDQSVALWGVLAKRFKNNPYVAGYDVINEPVAPSKEILHSFYQDAINKIREFDQNHIIFLEIDNAPENKAIHQIGGKYNDSNLAVSFHFYFPRQFTLPGGIQNMVSGLTYPGKNKCKPNDPNCQETVWNKEYLENIFNQAINLEELNGKPVYVGEFGASAIRDKDGALRWTEDVLSIMNQKGLHYTYHNYKHQQTYGYYWLMKPEVRQVIQKAIAGLADGSLKYENITDEQKILLMTENGYYRRNGIKEILTRYFAK